MMKLKESELEEALGVPENIIETSRIIYQQLIDYLEKNQSTFEELNDLEIKLKGDYQIKNHHFDEIEFGFRNYVHDGENIDLMGMAQSSSAKTTKKFRTKIVSPKNKVNLIITLIGNENLTTEDVIKYFEENQTKIIRILAHEIMHFFHGVMKRKESLKNRVSYNVASSFRFADIETLNNFLFLSYFINSIENIVRPTEIATEMSLTGVSKKDFLNFLTNNEVYKYLKQAQNFTYENLRESLKNELPKIKEMMTDAGENIDDYTDEKAIDKTFLVFLYNISRISAEQMFERLVNTPLEVVMGFQGEKDIFFRKYLNEIEKYKDDPETFFKKEEKKFHNISSQMIRKISKLYDFAKSKNESVKSYNNKLSNYFI